MPTEYPLSMDAQSQKAERYLIQVWRKHGWANTTVKMNGETWKTILEKYKHINPEYRVRLLRIVETTEVLHEDPSP